MAIITLDKIFERDDFLEEIGRCNELTRKNKRESGVCVYGSEYLAKIYVNEAILGKRDSLETDVTQESRHKKNMGT